MVEGHFIKFNILTYIPDEICILKISSTIIMDRKQTIKKYIIICHVFHDAHILSSFFFFLVLLSSLTIILRATARLLCIFSSRNDFSYSCNIIVAFIVCFLRDQSLDFIFINIKKLISF